MSTELVAKPEATFWSLSDDVQTHFETLEMVELQLAEAQEPEDRAALEQSRDELRAKLDAIGKELATKGDAIAGVDRRLTIESNAIETEEQRLRARRKSCERARQWLRNYVADAMQAHGMERLKTSLNTLYLRSSEAVEITDPDLVPAEYQNAEVKLPRSLWNAIVGLIQSFAPMDVKRDVDNVRVKAEPSLSAIRKVIKSGSEVPGADLKLNTHLVIR